jgi:predicted ester cyclase
MTNEEHKAIARRFFRAFATNDQATLVEVMASDFVIHVPGMPGPVDRETHLQGIGIFAAAFSEIDFAIENQIAEGDMVATRLTWRATHTGDFHGLRPAGKQIEINAVAIDRIKGGKIAERWFNQDDLGLMQQLDALPPA